MTTDYRALCAELLCSLEQYPVQPPRDRDLIDRARAALAQPEPQGPKLVYRYCPVTIAECGGPCEQGPEYCDCGEIKGEPAPQPEPQAPTVMEIIALADEIEAEQLGQVDLVRRALARWGNHALPVPQQEVK
jgi:hypothetical protein